MPVSRLRCPLHRVAAIRQRARQARAQGVGVCRSDRAESDPQPGLSSAGEREGSGAGARGLRPRSSHSHQSVCPSRLPWPAPHVHVRSSFCACVSAIVFPFHPLSEGRLLFHPSFASCPAFRLGHSQVVGGCHQFIQSASSQRRNLPTRRPPVSSRNQAFRKQ